MMNFEEVAEFTKEFKKLAKKYPSLPSDFQVFKNALVFVDLGKSTKNFTVLKEENCAKVVKARLKVECLKGVPKVRVVFILRIKANNASFLEIYTKSEKNREDEERINNYL